MATLALNVLSLGLPIVILQVYDRILPNQAVDTLFWLTTGLCVVLLLEWFFRMARAYVAGWAAAQYEHQASCRAIDRMLGANIGEFEKEAPGVYLDRVQAIDTLRDYYAGQARLWLVDLPFVVLFLGLFWFIGGALVIVPMALLGMLFGGALLVGDELKRALADRADVDHRRFSFVIEVLSGIHTAKLLAMEPLLQRRYERLQEQGASSTYRAVFFSNIAQSLGSLLSSMTMISVVLLGSVYVMTGALTIGGLAACTLLAGRTIQPLLRALGLWTQYQGIEVAQKRLDQLFKLAPEATNEATKAPKLAGGISLRDVSFGYDAKQKPILSGLNLDVAPGEAIGISGDTGSGKSTLLMLIRGLLTPTSGVVELDGMDISEWDPYSVRGQIGYLPQRTVLFQGTILENLTMFGGPEAIEGGLAAARNLGLDDVVHRLPAGYATKVGDGAEDDLPPGIKQGIAIARVLAARPRIVLFDEANNAFDRKSDNLLKDALEQLCGETTLVLVSHRPSILALADRIYELRDAKLVYFDESPPPAALDPPDALEAAIRAIAGLSDDQGAAL
ncbi:MAG: peptidase domain-containing ABC transporter [Alphaproteobacteria bacterium]|nr:peptidase domain-containing ABC transporter [Alphaproteobacteria bacterium]